MMQLGGFASAKEVARLPWGRTSLDYFTHFVDVQKRWDGALDARVALDLIGTQNVADGNLPDVKEWLGALTPEEERFRESFARLYERVAALTTTVPVTIDAEADFYETVLDTRLLQRAVAPRRVLDIGPGAGRHLANLALRPWGESSAYVGVESVGVPYLLQHTVGKALSLGDAGWRFLDQLESRPAPRVPLAPDDALRPRSAWHVPLWRTELLPSDAFDLIVCNYVLDEVSPPDFVRIGALIERCLAPGGDRLLPRRTAARAVRADLPLQLRQVPRPRHHGGAPVARLAHRTLRVDRLDAHARVLTERCNSLRADGYAAIATDAELVERVQQDYIESTVAALEATIRPRCHLGGTWRADARPAVRPSTSTPDRRRAHERTYTGRNISVHWDSGWCRCRIYRRSAPMRCSS